MTSVARKLSTEVTAGEGEALEQEQPPRRGDACFGVYLLYVNLFTCEADVFVKGQGETVFKPNAAGTTPARPAAGTAPVEPCVSSLLQVGKPMGKEEPRATEHPPHLRLRPARL